jgi:hypothetical protein
MEISRITICNIKRNRLTRTVETLPNPTGTHIVIETSTYDYLYNIKANLASIIRARWHSETWDTSKTWDIIAISKQKTNDLRQLICEYVT